MRLTGTPFWTPTLFMLAVTVGPTEASPQVFLKEAPDTLELSVTRITSTFFRMAE